MTFTVQSTLDHDGERYDVGDEFDDMTEAEAREAGLVPDVLVPQNFAQGGGGVSKSSKKESSKKDDDS